MSSTVKVANVQHPDAAGPAIELSGDGTVSIPTLPAPELELGDLTNVNTTGADAGDVLTFDGTGFAPQAAGGGVETATAPLTYDAGTQTVGTDGTLLVSAAPLISGRFYGPQRFNTLVGGGFDDFNNDAVLNKMFAIPWFLVKDSTIDGFRTSAGGNGGAGAVYRMGIYATGTDGLPGGLILDAGTVSMVTGGQKILNISPLSLPAGLYYLVSVGQGNNDQRIEVTGAFQPPVGVFYAPSGPIVSGGFHSLVREGISGALPNTFGTASPIQSAGLCQVRIA